MVEGYGPDGEDVGADVKFAGVVGRGGEEEGRVDVGLSAKVAEVGGYDSGVLRVVIVDGGVSVGRGSILAFVIVGGN